MISLTIGHPTKSDKIKKIRQIVQPKIFFSRSPIDTIEQSTKIKTVFRDQTRLLLLLGLLAAFALRIYKLGADSLWYDETVSVALASKSISDMLAHTAGDIHPPGYYLLLHFWQQITTPKVFASPSQTIMLEFLYAWPSLFCGVLIVALLFALGRKLFSTHIGVIAAGLAAINPYQIWYSQEVRMYTLIATIGLFALYALLRWNNTQRKKYLVAYTISAASGLYIHYYLLFGIIAFNLIALCLLWQQTARARRISQWIGAQVGVLLLWLPWLPTFWRQATDPPVPPWREQWTLSTFGTALYESVTALVVGQSLPNSGWWVWLILLIIIGAAFFAVQRSAQRASRPYSLSVWLIVMLYVFVPILILYSITALGTPIYHVRYLFLFAPLFLLVVANGLQTLWNFNRKLFWAILPLLFILNVIGLNSFWHGPAHRSDDHRAAVAALAQDWRPGDLILVNAGWTYTALESYWPSALNSGQASLPRQLEQRQRLTVYATDDPQFASTAQPLLLYTGTVDGDPNLGWGSPSSDFYAVLSAQVDTALTKVAGHYSRIWHYRLYDTNSDPASAIRTWLAQNSTQLDDRLYSGPASLRVQLFDTGTPPTAPSNVESAIAEFDSAMFGDVLQLDYAQYSASVYAGQTLYLDTVWRALAGRQLLPAALRFSLRIYSDQSVLVAQLDQSPLPPSNSWLPQNSQPQPLALPIPAGTSPGSYSLELVVYYADTGDALTLPDSVQSVFGQRLRIGDVDLLAASDPIHAVSHVANFDYIDLLSADVTPTESAPGDATMRVSLTWQPRANAYTDTYVAIFELRKDAADGALHQSWRVPLGGESYPSGEWVAEAAVNQTEMLVVEDLAEGARYRLMLRLERASDGLPIDARVGWWSHAAIELGEIRVVD